MLLEIRQFAGPSRRNDRLLGITNLGIRADCQDAGAPVMSLGVIGIDADGRFNVGECRRVLPFVELQSRATSEYAPNSEEPGGPRDRGP